MNGLGQPRFSSNIKGRVTFDRILMKSIRVSFNLKIFRLIHGEIKTDFCMGVDSLFRACCIFRPGVV